MENALRAKPEDVERSTSGSSRPAEAYGEAMLELRPDKIGVLVGQGRDRDLEPIRPQSLLDRDHQRRRTYYRPTKAPPTVKPELAAPIKALIKEELSFGYRTVAGLLGMKTPAEVCALAA